MPSPKRTFWCTRILVILLPYGALGTNFIELLPRGNISCRLGDNVDLEEGVACIVKHVAQATLRWNSAQTASVRGNDTLTLSCEVRNSASITYWDAGQGKGQFSAAAFNLQEKFFNERLQFENLVSWFKNGEAIDISREQPCTVDNLSSECDAFPNESGWLSIRSRQSDVSGTYTCIVVERCHVTPSSGRCWIKVGRAFKLAVEDNATSSSAAITGVSTIQEPNASITSSVNAGVTYHVTSDANAYDKLQEGFVHNDTAWLDIIFGSEAIPGGGQKQADDRNGDDSHRNGHFLYTTGVSPGNGGRHVRYSTVALALFTMGAFLAWRAFFSYI